MTQTAERTRAVIVDDEDLARQVVRELLQAHPEIEIVAECGNGFEAVKAVTELKPDLLFLDIQMPKLDGFEVLELIGTELAVIFATAYDQHALRAFEVHAVDYLLKPFGAERFEQALARARKRVREKLPAASDLKASTQSWIMPRRRMTTLLSLAKAKSTSSNKPFQAWKARWIQRDFCESIALTS